MSGEKTQDHIADSRRLLARVGGHGFPILVLERDGDFEVIDTGRWLGRPDEFRAHLMQHTA